MLSLYLTLTGILRMTYKHKIGMFLVGCIVLIHIVDVPIINLEYHTCVYYDYLT